MAIETDGEIDHKTDAVDATAHAHEIAGAETGRGTKSARAPLSPSANGSIARVRRPPPNHHRPSAAAAVALDHVPGPHISATRNLCPTKRSPSVASTTQSKHPPNTAARLLTKRSRTSRVPAPSQSTPTASKAPKSPSSTTSHRKRANLPHRSPGACLFSRATM